MHAVVERQSRNVTRSAHKQSFDPNLLTAQRGPVVERSSQVRVVRTEHLLSYGLRLLVEWLCLCVVALRIISNLLVGPSLNHARHGLGSRSFQDCLYGLHLLSLNSLPAATPIF